LPVDDPNVEEPKQGDLFHLGTRAVIKRMERGATTCKSSSWERGGSS